MPRKMKKASSLPSNLHKNGMRTTVRHNSCPEEWAPVEYEWSYGHLLLDGFLNIGLPSADVGTDMVFWIQSLHQLYSQQSINESTLNLDEIPDEIYLGGFKNGERSKLQLTLSNHLFLNNNIL